KGGGKLAGIAQRVGANSALVSGVVVVEAGGGLREVLSAVYDRLDVAFDPSTVGSVATAGGTSDPDRVVAEIEAAFLDGREAALEPLEE
ncbi:MAG: lipoate--protein ligase family protein, partial [Haloferacaceae archaeon]